MEKTYKRVPFDIELAKKIQSGEVEGKFCCDLGTIQIIALDVRPTSDTIEGTIIATFMFGERELLMYNDQGVCTNRRDKYNLYIELPEGTPKHEFKVGDKVAYAGIMAHITSIDNDKGLADIDPVVCGVFHNIDISKLEFVDDSQPTETKHEFKPFDKVLVRDTEDFRTNCERVWVSRLYDYKDTHDPDKLRHWCQDGCSYTDCIPYEGNEDLVGTTNNPE